MTEPPLVPPLDPRTRKLADAIAKTERDQKAAIRRSRSMWVQVSQVGTLGWMLALPIIGGALLGHLIDRWLGTGLSFALAFLVLGLAVAGYALWRQVHDLDRDD